MYAIGDNSPVIDEILDFVDAALSKQAEDQAMLVTRAQKIAALQSELESKEKVILEKVAAANTPVFDPTQLESLFDHLEDIRVMTPQERVKVANHIKKDPNMIFPMIEKISSILRRPPSEGGGIDRGELSLEPASTDPDGWDDMCASRPVKLHK